MSPIRYWPAYLGLYLMLCIAVWSVVGFTPVVGAASAFIWPVFYAAGLLCGWQYGRNQSAGIKAAGAVVMVIGLLMLMGSLAAGNLEYAVVVFLLAVQGAHTFTLCKRRDLYFAISVSLFLITYAASVTRSNLFVFAVVLYVVMGMFTLMAAHIDEKLLEARSGDGLKGNNYLPVRGVGIAVLILSAALAMYLFIPRLPALNIVATPFGGGWFYENEGWEKEAQMGGGRGGTGQASGRGGAGREESGGGGSEWGGASGESSGKDTLPADGGGGCTLDNSIIFYVRSDTTLYVRDKSFDFFDGTVWKNSLEGGLKIIDEGSTFKLFDPAGRELSYQTYYIERPMPDMILNAYRPATVWFPSRVIELGPGEYLRAPAAIRRNTQYSVSSAIDFVEGHPSGGAEAGLMMERYLQLPPDLSTKVGELAQDVAGDAGDDFTKATAVERYLKEEYPYTLDTVFRRSEGNVVNEFLFDLKRGHCEYFASSMVMMLRSLGIPARIVAGFAATAYNPITGYIEVRGTNGHAWVEAYFKEQGWVTFEPTPSYELPSEIDDVLAFAGISRYLGELIETFQRLHPKSLWTGLIRKAKLIFVKLKETLRVLYLRMRDVTMAMVNWALQGGWKKIATAAVLLIAATLAYAKIRPLLIRARLRHLRKRDPDRFVIECFSRAERVFARRGLGRPASLSPLEYEGVLVRENVDLREQIHLIVGALQRVLYGGLRSNAAETERLYEALLNIEREKSGKRSP